MPRKGNPTPPHHQPHNQSHNARAPPQHIQWLLSKLARIESQDQKLAQGEIGGTDNLWNEITWYGYYFCSAILLFPLARLDWQDKTSGPKTGLEKGYIFDIRKLTSGYTRTGRSIHNNMLEDRPWLSWKLSLASPRTLRPFVEVIFSPLSSKLYSVCKCQPALFR